MAASLVNQGRASAGGDVIAGNKTEINLSVGREQLGVVGQLLAKLQSEVEKNIHVRHTVETLARFHVRRVADGVVGLEAKLKAADRESELLDALEKKELFAKMLERWALYASAQEIFAVLLARIEYEFNYFIAPQLPCLSRLEVNQLVNDKIVVPTISECGASVFVMDHATAMGMVYWLAEQCYVRWHL